MGAHFAKIQINMLIMKPFEYLSGTLVLIVIMAFFSVEANAQEQGEQPDIYEQAEMEADRLQRVLDLEDWQVFYVDSTL